MATAGAASGICRLCHRPGPTRPVVFRQNIGVILVRLTRRVEGPLCRGCIESSFSDMTLTTFFAGWWSLTSLFVTPFILVSNIAEYLDASRSRELQGVPSSRRGRTAIITIVAALVAAVIAGLSLVAVFAWLVTSTPSTPRRDDGRSHAGVGGLREAEGKIVAYQGQSSFGNSGQAERYAAGLAEKMALARSIAFTGGRRENAASLTEGRFLTYCELREGKVCFIVHVPELRNYSPSAREALAKMAWALAQQTVESRPDAGTLRLGVGLRGVLLYGVVMTGPARGGTQPPWSDDPAPLPEFFVGPLVAAPSAEPTAAPTPPVPEPTPTPSLPFPERLKRDIEAIGLSEPEPRHAAESDLESLGLVAVPALLKTARDPARPVEARATAMHLLGKSGSPEAVPALLRCLEDRGAGHAAGEGLRYVKDAETSVLPLLARGIRKRCTRRIEVGTPASVYCWNAVNTLGAFKAAAAFAVPVLLEVMAAQESGLGLQTTAITAAGKIGPAARDAVPYMILGLKHADSYVNRSRSRLWSASGPTRLPPYRRWRSSAVRIPSTTIPSGSRRRSRASATRQRHGPEGYRSIE